MAYYTCDTHTYLFTDKEKHLEFHKQLSQKEQWITSQMLQPPIITRVNKIKYLWDFLHERRLRA